MAWIAAHVYRVVHQSVQVYRENIAGDIDLSHVCPFVVDCSRAQIFARCGSVNNVREWRNVGLLFYGIVLGSDLAERAHMGMAYSGRLLSCLHFDQTFIATPA